MKYTLLARAGIWPRRPSALLGSGWGPGVRVKEGTAGVPEAWQRRRMPPLAPEGSGSGLGGSRFGSLYGAEGSRAVDRPDGGCGNQGLHRPTGGRTALRAPVVRSVGVGDRRPAPTAAGCSTPGCSTPDRRGPAARSSAGAAGSLAGIVHGDAAAGHQQKQGLQEPQAEAGGAAGEGGIEGGEDPGAIPGSRSVRC